MEKKQPKYRFEQREIEAMKKNILDECEFNRTALEHGHKPNSAFPEFGKYTAANIRRCFESGIKEYGDSSKYRKFYERQLALYEMLTENDMPNWLDQMANTAAGN